jgi:hypothetical protein
MCAVYLNPLVNVTTKANAPQVSMHYEIMLPTEGSSIIVDLASHMDETGNINFKEELITI